MSGDNYRPHPWKIRRVPTVFMDYTTGRGVLDNGQPFRADAGTGRKHPNLTDKLNAVSHMAGPGVERIRIMLTGKVPPNDRNTRHWLLVQTPGWSAERGHWLGTPPTGRFTHNTTGQYIEVRVASEWFGNTPLNPAQARESWDLLDSVLTYTYGPSLPEGMNSTLMLTPAATGQNLWAASMPKGLNPEPVTDDIAAELHATSGQHHLDHLVGGTDALGHPDVVPLIDTRLVGSLPRFTYIDGRFMYASLCREIGTGPGVRLNRAQAYDLLESQPYARARYEVAFTVPDDWRHVGIFGRQHENPSDGWFYPNRPGAKGVTWADSSEVFVAQKAGWRVEPLQAIQFTETMSAARKRFYGDDHVARKKAVKARPLDLWANKLVTARENIAKDPQLPVELKQAVGAALRAILIQSIGSFASRGRGATVVVDDPKEIPSRFAGSVIRKGKLWAYTIPQELSARQQAFYRPEFAAQVWGRGRAKVLRASVAGQAVGALSLPGGSIIGINGDAIYTTEAPQWALPVDQGGLDDGAAGRLRLQGHLPGPVDPPPTRAEREILRGKAQAAGTELLAEDIVDQSAFALEFDTTADSPDAYQESES